jgi:hypothetical protein
MVDTSMNTPLRELFGPSSVDISQPTLERAGATPVTFATKVAVQRLRGHCVFFAHIMAIFTLAKTVATVRNAIVKMFTAASETCSLSIDQTNFFFETEYSGAKFPRLLQMALKGKDEALRTELRSCCLPADAATGAAGSMPITPLEDLGGAIVKEEHLACGANSSVRMVTLADGRVYVAKSFPPDMAALTEPRAVTIEGFSMTVPGPLTMAQQCFGVQVTAPQTSDAYAQDVISRNLVSYEIAEHFTKLGNGANPTIPIVKSHAVRVPKADGGYEVQLFMERAEGIAREDNTEPICAMGQKPTKTQVAEVLRQETHLQIIDFILGQKDRQSGNVYFDFGTDGASVKVTGVDNDLCLPEVETAEEMGIYDKRPKELPYFMDEEMAKAIEQMRLRDLVGIMRRNGRDPRQEPHKTEFALMAQRVAALKTHVAKIRSGDIITTENIAKWVLSESATKTTRKYGEILPNRDAWNRQQVIDGQMPVTTTEKKRERRTKDVEFDAEKTLAYVTMGNAFHEGNSYIVTHMASRETLRQMHSLAQ